MDGHVFDQEWTRMDMNGEWTGMGDRLAVMGLLACHSVFQTRVAGSDSVPTPHQKFVNVLFEPQLVPFRCASSLLRKSFSRSSMKAR